MLQTKIKAVGGNQTAQNKIIDNLIITKNGAYNKPLDMDCLSIFGKDQAMEIITNLADHKSFYSTEGIPYIITPKGETFILSHKNSDFTDYVQTLIWDKSDDTMVTINDILMAIGIIRRRSKTAEQRAVFNRIGHNKDKTMIFYDLNNSKNEVVYISAEGIEIKAETPVFFRKGAKMDVQTTPVFPGKAERLGKGIEKIDNFIQNLEPDKKMLYRILLLSYFVPFIQHPLINIYGTSGSGKSSISGIIYKLVDPMIGDSLEGRLPQNTNDIFTALFNSYIKIFGNISKITHEQSDLFCTCITGGDLEKRKLYSDNDLVSYSIKRRIGLNGLHNCIEKPDLLDRSLTFESATPKKKDSDNDYWGNFEKSKGEMLGDIFQIVSDSMQIIDNIKVETKYRLQDFAKWGVAFCRVCGWDEKKFLQSLANETQDQALDLIEENVYAHVLYEHLKTAPAMEGNATEILNMITPTANKLGYYEGYNGKWDKNSRKFGKVLAEFQKVFAEKGISIVFRKSDGRKWTIKKQAADV